MAPEIIVDAIEGTIELQSQVKKVYAAIAAVMADLAKAGIAKNKRNIQQGFDFRGIDDVHNALAPVLSKHKLLMLPRVVGRQMETRTTSQNKLMFAAMLEMEFDLISAEDGSCHVVRIVGEGMDVMDKAINKALSAAYKYAAIQSFCIPVNGKSLDDSDADEIGAARKKNQPLKNPLEKMIPSFAKLGVTKGMLEIYLGHSLDKCTEKEIEGLRGKYQLLEQKKKTWKEIIDPQMRQLTQNDITPAADGAEF
jgi:hypothetical protein